MERVAKVKWKTRSVEERRSRSKEGHGLIVYEIVIPRIMTEVMLDSLAGTAAKIKEWW